MGAARSDTNHVDPTQVASETEPIAVARGAESGVREYFAAVDWLSDPSLGPDGAVRDPFTDALYFDGPDYEQVVGRNSGRTQWWFPRFRNADDPYSDRANATTDIHPVVTYDYSCTDGRQAFVSHYVHDDAAYRGAWKRPDFLGEVDHDPSTNRVTLSVETNDPESFRTDIGYLRPTGVGGGPLAGAEYALTLGEISESTGIPLIPGTFVEGYLQYGFYQYFSFVDDGGTEVEVQIIAPSLDFPDGWLDLEDESPSILTGNADPFDFVDHEDVAARFDCGVELANRLAPVIAALDTGT